jgi:hypothetical protein
MERIGIPEILVLLVIALSWLIPIAAGVWALLMLHHVRAAQEDMRRRLESIERVLQRTAG